MATSIQKLLQLFPLASKVLKMVPSADIKNRQEFSATDIVWLAKETGVFLQSTDLDYLHQEWLSLQLEDIPEPSTPTSPSYFWDAKAYASYPKVTTLMRAILSIPHSNASSERVFSMLKKIQTDQRADLCHDSINALLSIKVNMNTCCYDTVPSASLLKNLKKASKLYNNKHPPSTSASSSPDNVSLDDE